MEDVPFGPQLPNPTDRVPEVAHAAAAASTSSVLSPTAVEVKAPRVLVARTSRERSPHGLRSMSTTTSLATSTQQAPESIDAEVANFSVGQAVVLVGLVSRADLVGKCGIVKSFDSASMRYAVCTDVSGQGSKFLG